MAGNALTAGVKPGGLTTRNEIRILLCYLIKMAQPLTMEAVQNALLNEQLVNYFELAGALGDLVEQNLAVQDEQGAYRITGNGATVADTLSDDLPRSVRESAVRAVLRAQTWLRMAAQHKAEIVERKDHFSVHCSIEDMGEPVFELNLAMPDEATAQLVRKKFVEQGSELYSLFINFLTS